MQNNKTGSQKRFSGNVYWSNIQKQISFKTKESRQDGKFSNQITRTSRMYYSLVAELQELSPGTEFWNSFTE